MNTKKNIELEIDGLVGLKNLVEVYQEVAATRMQRVRGAVLQSRMFNDGLMNVFGKVRTAYKQMKLDLKPLRRLNGRTVAVVITANSGLYGEIVTKTFATFVDFVKANKPDVVVIGRQGSAMMIDQLPDVLFNFYDFPDESIDMESFDLIMRYLIHFERIVVFHGQFLSILQQVPRQTLVSGEAIKVDVNPLEKSQTYLFEPDVETIAKIFEGEIMASILEQSLHESMLSKQASRMLSLDRSLESVDQRLGRVYFDKRKVLHGIRNKKQLSTISGFSLWH